MSTPSDIEGFRWLLDTARREAERLLDTTHRLFRDEIDAAWVDALEQSPELAERVDAFGARFGRLQDGIGHKLIPELRRLLLEPPAAALDNLNHMEKLGLLTSVRHNANPPAAVPPIDPAQPNRLLPAPRSASR